MLFTNTNEYPIQKPMFDLMFRSLIVLLACCLALAVSNASGAARPHSEAPAFNLPAADGSKVSLADLKGKTVVLEWLNYECPFSKMHYDSGNLPKMQAKYTGKDVVWLSIASSAKGKQGYFTAQEYVSENKKFENHASHVLLDVDGEVARKYGAKTTPHMYVIGPDGIVQYNGAIDSIPSSNASTLATAEPLAANAIEAVLAGKQPSPAATRPYGCGIKYGNVSGYDK